MVETVEELALGVVARKIIVEDKVNGEGEGEARELYFTKDSLCAQVNL